MADAEIEDRIRVAMFHHLDALLARHPNGAVRSAEINTFVFDGRAVPLIVQPGIWKPQVLSAALTIRTTFTSPNSIPPYVDQEGADGLFRYAYRGTDPSLSDNRGLRQAWEQRLPLAYFVGVSKGVYRPVYPVWIVDDAPDALHVTVAVDAAQLSLVGASYVAEPMPLAAANREYSLRLTKQRLHQPVFRTQVLLAYGDACSMCRLRHAELLDAAHIVADNQPLGDPVVPNGIALCKIHHAAFDANIVGVRPDMRIEVRRDVLEEIDGPMLRHGLQDLAGEALHVPRGRDLQPDPERLGIRYEEFRLAS